MTGPLPQWARKWPADYAMRAKSPASDPSERPRSPLLKTKMHWRLSRAATWTIAGAVYGGVSGSMYGVHRLGDMPSSLSEAAQGALACSIFCALISMIVARRPGLWGTIGAAALVAVLVAMAWT